MMRALAAAARARALATEGFGCPPLSAWPPHLRVEIPEGRGGDIALLEDPGLAGEGEAGHAAERCALPRARWNAMADAAKAELNARLREKGLPPSRWRPGANVVERVLGAELLALAWAVAAADEELIPAVVARWARLEPAQRLFLSALVRASGGADMARRGLAMLLSAPLPDGPPPGPRTPPARKVAPKVQPRAIPRTPSLFDRTD